MGVIKTALEIALERTESVKSDKSSIDQFDAKQRGKKIANGFLSGEVDLALEIKKTAKEQQKSLKQGVFDVLLSQIALPGSGDDALKMEAIGKGLDILMNSSKFNAMYKQLMQAFAQFLQEAGQYEKVIRQQYAPKLRQKEEELSRRMGREVRIDPLQDPEFITFFNQHAAALRAKYEPFVEQIHEAAAAEWHNS